MAKKKAEKVSPFVPVEEQPYQVPENWCWIRLLSAFDNKTDSKKKLPQKEYAENGEIPIVDQGKELIGGYTDKVELSYGGDLPVIVFGDHTRCVKFVDFDFVQGADGIKVLVPQKYWDRKAFYYAFQSIDIPNMGYRRHYPLFGQFSLPLPPIAEQQRIVDRIESLFAKLDEAKEKTQEALDSFKTRKETLLYKALRGELTAEWRTSNSYSMLDWIDEILGNVCVINPQKINTKNLPDDLEVSFFPMPALSEITGEITEPQTRKLAEVRQGFTNFSEGDVVFAKITPCMENGKCAVIGKLVNNIGFGTTEFFVLRCSARLSNRYLFHILRSITFRNEAKSVMAGAVGQQRVPKSFLVEYPLHLPPIDEQCEIVRILDDFFAKEAEAKAKVEATLDAIDSMKKSILAKAFRGELGTNNPEDESAEELLKRTLV